MRGWSKQQRKLGKWKRNSKACVPQFGELPSLPSSSSRISAARSVVWTWSACGLVKLRYHHLSAFVSPLNYFARFVLYSLQSVTQEREASLAATIRRVARSPAIVIKDGLEALENGQVVEATVRVDLEYQRAIEREAIELEAEVTTFITHARGCNPRL